MSQVAKADQADVCLLGKFGECPGEQLRSVRMAHLIHEEETRIPPSLVSGQPFLGLASLVGSKFGHQARIQGYGPATSVRLGRGCRGLRCHGYPSLYDPHGCPGIEVDGRPTQTSQFPRRSPRPSRSHHAARSRSFDTEVRNCLVSSAAHAPVANGDACGPGRLKPARGSRETSSVSKA